MEKKTSSPSSVIISIDPGISHLAIVIGKATDLGSEIKFEIISEKTANIGGSTCPDPQKLVRVVEEIARQVADIPNPVWVIEYQPPLNTFSNPGLVRKNTWVEAFFITWCLSKGFRYKVVASSAVKSFFQFPKSEPRSQYQSNKKNAVRIAEELIGQKVPNDHIADCILNGVYAFQSVL